MRWSRIERAEAEAVLDHKEQLEDYLGVRDALMRSKLKRGLRILIGSLVAVLVIYVGSLAMNAAIPTLIVSGSSVDQSGRGFTYGRNVGSWRYRIYVAPPGLLRPHRSLLHAWWPRSSFYNRVSGDGIAIDGAALGIFGPSVLCELLIDLRNAQIIAASPASRWMYRNHWVPVRLTSWVLVDVILVGLLIGGCEWLAAAGRERWRRAKGKCPSCGYPLHGLSVCPDCGLANADPRIPKQGG
jgi:hypothetical protein